MPRSPKRIIQFVRGSERYGAAISIKNLCGELDRRGHEVILLLSKGGSLGFDPGQFRTIEVEPHHKFDPRGLKEIRAILRREKPDLVHTHLSAATLTGSWAARLEGIPVIATVHGMNKRWTYNFADRLITVSEAGKTNMVNQGLKAEKISVAYNGIPMPDDSAPLQRQSVRQELGFEVDSVVLGAVSRADHGKGIQDALTAVAMLMRRIPKVSFAFAGEGDYLQSLRGQAKILGIDSRVRFLGYRSNIYELLSAVDLFVFPSLREAMGISVVEAMSMGKPIIGTKIGGIPEVVDSDSGVLVPANNAPALADACFAVLNDPHRMEAMGLHAKNRAQMQFSLSASADSVEDAYHILLNRGRARTVTAGSA